jgi:4-hydroxy-2-oxoheptanedioate aldolase
MRENRTKRILAEGGVALGFHLGFCGNPLVAGLLATAGFDFASVDLEHSRFSTETLANLIAALRYAGVTPIPRVQSCQAETFLSRPLDLGAQGVMVPRVETPEQVRFIVERCRYYPEGQRSVAGAADIDFDLDLGVDRFPQVNANTLVAIQVESATAIDRLDELLAVGGVDAVFHGPADLAQSLGKPGQVDDPEVQGYFARIIPVCERHGVAPGMTVGAPEAAAEWIDRGMRALVLGNDTMLLATQLRNSAERVREHLARHT